MPTTPFRPARFGIASAMLLALPIIPAPLPVTWGLIVVALVYAAARSRAGESQAWLIAVGIALIIGVGLAAERLWTDGALPWAVLAAALVFVLTHRD